MRKINSLQYDGCAFISDIHLVSNVLQQNWPLAGLDFTDSIFIGDLTPFILSCFQSLKFPADKAFTTTHLSSGSRLQRKILNYARPKDRVLPEVLHSNRKGPQKKHSWRMRTELLALCFLHGTEACCMFFLTLTALRVCHVSRTSLMKKRKKDSHLWFRYSAF